MSNAKERRAKRTLEQLKIMLLRQARGEFQAVDFKQLPAGLAEVLVESGEPHTVRRVEFVHGRMRDCFRNAAQFVRANDGYGFGIGFALTDLAEGSYWIFHAWGVSLDAQTIVETTGPRRLYFGVVYDREEGPTKMFAEAPDSPDRLAPLRHFLEENQ